MRLRHPLRSLAAALASASLLTMIHSHVLAQADEIPETVLITPSRIRGVTLSPPLGPAPTRLTDDEIRRLTQLTDDELRLRARGVRIRQRGDSFTHTFRCDGSWAGLGALIPSYGVYSVRDNQVCVEGKIGGGERYCFKLFRNEAGDLFGDLTPGLLGIRPLEATGVETCPQR